MNNTQNFRIVSIGLAGVLAAGLTGCQLFKKKEPETPESTPPAGEAATTPATPGTSPPAPAEPPPGEAQPGPETSAATKPPPQPTTAEATPAPQPEGPDMTEFAGMLKSEAEFILECRKLGESGSGMIPGRGGLAFSRAELRELGANRGKNAIRHRNIIGSLAAYAARVKAGGAEFVLVPVPPKAVIYPDYLPREPALKDRRYDSYLESLYSELRKSGVRVIDMTDELRKHRLEKKRSSFPKSDPHWSAHAAQMAAETLFKELKRAPSLKNLAKDKTIDSKEVTITAVGEPMLVRTVGRKAAGGLEPITPAQGREAIVLVGDANAMVYAETNWPSRFNANLRAGFADQIAFEFGVPVELRANPALDWKGAPEQFRPGSSAAVKVVVLCIAATSFLEDAAPPAPRVPRPADHSNTGARPRASKPAPSGGALRLRDDPNLDLRRQ